MLRAALLTALAVLAAAAPAQALPSARVSPTGTDFLSVAHRGASGLAPEHTFAAYDLALQLGADVIEQDVAPTADGQLVVLHDDTLDRTTDCTGRPDQKTLAELKRCDAGSWFNEAHPELARPEYVGQRIPTFDEVLARYGDSVNYYVETKIYENGGALEAGVIAALRRHGLEDNAVLDRQVHLQTFLPQHLARMRLTAPRFPRVFLLQGLLAPVNATEIAFAQANGASGIGPTAQETDAAFVRRAHDAGLQVHPYTVDDAAGLERLERVDADGAFTNRPDVLEQARRGRFADGVPRGARGGRRTSFGALAADAVAGGGPAAGISAIVPDGRRAAWALPDDQFDTPKRSREVPLRILRLRLSGGRATVTRTIALTGPDGTPLTGATLDPEALVRTRDGGFWIGDDRGPSVLRFDRRGRQDGPAIALDGLMTPWSAPGGAAATVNPLSPRALPAGTRQATVLPSRGIQGLALRRGRLLALVAGPVAGEGDARTRVIVELDPATRTATGRRFRFEVAGPGHVAADLALRPGDDRHVFVIDRDTRAGRDARYKTVTRVDLRTGAATPVLDLLALRDPRRRAWAMPFAEIDALAITRGGDVVVANDNDLPFSTVRRPNAHDPTEIVTIRPDRALRPR